MDNSRTKFGIQEEIFFLRSFLKEHDQEIMNVFNRESLMQEHLVLASNVIGWSHVVANERLEEELVN